MSINLKKENITWLSESYKLETPKTTVKNRTDLQYNLDILQRELKTATRQLDYWDVYKFEFIVNNKEDIGDLWARLAANHSMIINCDGCEFKSQSLNRGDVIIKLDNGLDYLIINAMVSGAFYPDVNGNVVTWKYTNKPNELPTSVPVQIDTSTVNIYCEKKQPIDHAITFNSIDGVEPIIRFYTIDGEEVYADKNITLEDYIYTVSNIPSVVKYVVVK